MRRQEKTLLQARQQVRKDTPAARAARPLFLLYPLCVSLCNHCPTAPGARAGRGRRGWREGPEPRRLLWVVVPTRLRSRPRPRVEGRRPPSAAGPRPAPPRLRFPAPDSCRAGQGPRPASSGTRSFQLSRKTGSSSVASALSDFWVWSTDPRGASTARDWSLPGFRWVPREVKGTGLPRSLFATSAGGLRYYVVDQKHNTVCY